MNTIRRHRSLRTASIELYFCNNWDGCCESSKNISGGGGGVDLFVTRAGVEVAGDNKERYIYSSLQLPCHNTCVGEGGYWGAVIDCYLAVLC